MYKIEIHWGFRSPHLQVANGIVRIDSNLDIGGIDPKKIPGFPVQKDHGSLAYKNCDALFNRCKPLVDVMVRSYYDGLLMRDLSVTWFDGCSRHNNDVTLRMTD
jgi:hypothetical protein